MGELVYLIVDSNHEGKPTFVPDTPAGFDTGAGTLTVSLNTCHLWQKMLGQAAERIAQGELQVAILVTYVERGNSLNIPDTLEVVDTTVYRTDPVRDPDQDEQWERFANG
jgi:hypothetical protein